MANVESITAVVKLADGTESHLLLTRAGYTQWGANMGRLGRTVDLAAALADAARDHMHDPADDDGCPDDPDGLHHDGCGCDDVCGYCQNVGCDACSESHAKESARAASAADARDNAERAEPWCDHDPAALDRDDVCECGVDVQGPMVVRDGYVLATSYRGTWLVDGADDEREEWATLAAALDHGLPTMKRDGVPVVPVTVAQLSAIARTVTVAHPAGAIDAHSVPAGHTLADTAGTMVRAAELALRNPAASVRMVVVGGYGERVPATAHVVGGDRVHVDRDDTGENVAVVGERGHGVWDVVSGDGLARERRTVRTVPADAREHVVWEDTAATAVADSIARALG